MICEYAGVEYEFKGYKNPDEWFKEDKPTLSREVLNCGIPYCLDGKHKMTESLAIIQYLCDQYKPELLGTTPQERALTRQLILQLGDIINQMSPIAMKGSPETMLEKAKEVLTPVFKYLGSKKFLTGNEVRACDFMLFEQIEFLYYATQGQCVTDFPHIEDYQAQFKELPKLKEYFEKPDSWANTLYFMPPNAKVTCQAKKTW